MRSRAALAWQSDLHWTTAFTTRLTETVKLVGSTISCGGTFRGELHRSPQRAFPHVQSYALATDQLGLKARPDVLAAQTSMPGLAAHTVAATLISFRHSTDHFLCCR